MKIQDIRELSAQELEDKVKNLKQELFNLRFQNATNQLDNPIKIAQVKKDIARVKTIIREQQLARRQRGGIEDGKQNFFP